MSIGNALAEARRQAGMTITDVSHRTCIRETIIRQIERGDFSACGGDFYARGHVRSIANAVGVDPEPIIAEYDRTQGVPHTISAAEVFQPATPIKLKGRRRPHWAAAMLVALILIGGVFAYEHYAHRGGTDAPAAHNPPSTVAHHPKRPAPTTSIAPVHHSHRLNIHVVATQDCWIQLTSVHTGRTIFSGTLYAGSTQAWIEYGAIYITVGNPSGIRLRVNGKDPVPAGQVTTWSHTLEPLAASRH